MKETARVILIVTVRVEDQEPNQGEHKPGNVERGREPEQRPGPGEVYHGGEEVLQVPDQQSTDEQKELKIFTQSSSY